MNGPIKSRLDPSELDVQKEKILALLRRMDLSDYEAKTYLALVLRSHGSAEGRGRDR